MATLKEIDEFVGSAEDLRAKIRGALRIKAMLIVNDAASTAAQNAFALACLGNPAQYEVTVLNGVMGEHNALTVAQISGASDVDIQAAANKVVDQLLGVA